MYTGFRCTNCIGHRWRKVDDLHSWGEGWDAVLQLPDAVDDPVAGARKAANAIQQVQCKRRIVVIMLYRAIETIYLNDFGENGKQG